MVSGIFDEHGIRFEYPLGWAVEVETDGTRTTISLQSPDGPAFALIVLDDQRPGPIGIVKTAQVALTEEYPELESSPVVEQIAGCRAYGYDIEFISLDAANTCAIRCFRTDRRTVFVFNQWSDLEDGDPGHLLRCLRASLQETDS